MNFEHTETLKKSGLSESQAIVFEALLRLGEQKAGSLAKFVPLKRTLVYKVLDDLVVFGLAEKTEIVGEVAHFLPKHPSKLRELVDSRVKMLKEAEQTLEGLLPTLTSQFNLKSGQPGVLLYEGKDAVEKILEDTILSTTDIYSYVDPLVVDEYHTGVSKRFLKLRQKELIVKHLLVPDSPQIASRYTKEKYPVNEVRVIEKAPKQFPVALQIYSNKVSFLTLLPNRIIGVIIEDPMIYELQKFLFLALYEQCRVILSGPRFGADYVAHTPGTTDPLLMASDIA